MAGNALKGPKRVFFDRIFERAYWTWRRHLAVVVPTMLGAGLALVEQSIVVTVVVALLTGWALQGTLSKFLTEYRLYGLFTAFQDPSFSSWLIAALAIIAGLLVLVVIIGEGYVYSAEYGTYVEAWNSPSVPIASVLANGRRKWSDMAWTFFLSNLITWGPAAIGYGAVLVSAFGSTASGNLIGVVVSATLLQPLIYVSLILSVFTVYSYPAVMVEGVSGFTAVRRSFAIAGHNLGLTLTYCIVRVIIYLPVLLIRFLPGLFAAPLGIPLTSLVTVVLGFVLTPVLHMTKTMIFYYSGPTVPEMPYRPSARIWNDVFGAFLRVVEKKIVQGLRDIAGFVIGPRNYPFHLISILAFVLGILIGNFVSNNGVAAYYLALGYRPGHGNPLLNQVIQPALGVDIFLNNWYVSIGTAMAGLGFGAPSFATILFNGFILGTLAVPALSPSLTMFLAAILPHGIIEIPCFVLAGSAGMRLGYAALLTWVRKGPESSDYLSRSLRLAVYVVVGLAPLFLVAGLIEADITPIIMRMFGWTF